MKSDLELLKNQLNKLPADKKGLQPVREAVNDRGLFTADWFGVREKHCSPLEIYDRLRANEQAACCWLGRVRVQFVCFPPSFPSNLCRCDQFCAYYSRFVL